MPRNDGINSSFAWRCDGTSYNALRACQVRSREDSHSRVCAGMEEVDKSQSYRRGPSTAWHPPPLAPPRPILSSTPRPQSQAVVEVAAKAWLRRDSLLLSWRLLRIRTARIYPVCGELTQSHLSQMDDTRIPEVVIRTDTPDMAHDSLAPPYWLAPTYTSRLITQVRSSQSTLISQGPTTNLPSPQATSA
jgi:hypothetical protein